MKQETISTRARLATPRAAAVAGILFAVLLITGLLLFRLAVRADPLEAGAWLKSSSNMVGLALILVPLAGIAFLWFIGVLRADIALRSDICLRVDRLSSFESLVASPNLCKA